LVYKTNIFIKLLKPVEWQFYNFSRK
jgi:hypothetical protein